MSRKVAKPKQSVFCLFHECSGCECIKPVTDLKTLVMRREHARRLAEYERQAEERWETRKAEMKSVSNTPFGR